jgi:UDP-galactopyranose mutase
MAVLKNYLRTLDIESRGRFGEWEYFNMDHSILSGKSGVEQLRSALEPELAGVA